MAKYNDLKAPRARIGGRLPILSKEFFKFLLEKHPDFPIKDWNTFRKKCADGLAAIAELITDTREGIELPKMTGFIIVASCERPRCKVKDYGLSIKHGKHILQSNLHSDGRLAAILYTNYPVKYRLKYRELWGFTACRNFSRLVSKKFKEAPENFMKFSYSDRLSWRFRHKHIVNKKNYYE